MKIREWFRRLRTGKPHFIIGDPAAPYLLRWFLIPRNRWFNVYLHKFCRDDIDRALHDHPWWSVSLCLRGGYIEHYERNGVTAVRRVRPGRVTYRPAVFRHRVEVLRKYEPLSLGHWVHGETLIPAWTLFVTGPKVRVWGFWCPKGFVPWDQFVDRDNKGEVGAGCGEVDA